MSPAAPSADPLVRRASRVDDRARGLRQAWPLIAAISVLVAIAATLLMVAAAITTDHGFVGAWKTEAGSHVDVRETNGTYWLRVDGATGWTSIGQRSPKTGQDYFVATLPAEVISSLSSGDTRVPTDVIITLDADHERLLVTAPRLASGETRTLASLSRRSNPLDALALAALAMSAVLLIVTIVIGRSVGLKSDDRLLPGVGVAVGVCAVLAMAGVWVATAVMIPVMLLAWSAILARWLLPVLPDIGGGLMAIFTTGGRRAFAENVRRQNEQSDRGDALEAVVDEVQAERGA